MIPFLWSSLANATTYTPLADLEELVEASDAAVFGEVRRLRAATIDGMIWTIATIVPATGSPVEVRYLGGCVDGVCMTVPGAPRMESGEQVVVFLRHGQPTHFADGVFHVRGEAGWTDLAAVAVRDGRTAVVQAPLAALLESASALLPPSTNP